MFKQRKELLHDKTFRFVSSRMEGTFYASALPITQEDACISRVHNVGANKQHIFGIFQHQPALPEARRSLHLSS